jgi:hypothetical protein
LALIRKRGILITATYQGRLVAGGVFVSDGIDMRALILASDRLTAGGSTSEIVGWANRMVIWDALRFAHLVGHKQLDLGGIRPDSDNRRLVSLAAFKEAFGGERVANYYYTRTDWWLLRAWVRLRNVLK